MTAVRTSLSTTASNYQPVFNVKDSAYGAIGNDTADDAPAIRLAHAACVAAGGGVVYFPKGTYRCASVATAGLFSVILAQANLAGTVRFQGAGRGTSIIHVTTPCSSFTTCSPDSSHPIYEGYEFADFTLDAGGRVETYAGYLIHYSASATGNHFDVGYHLVERVESKKAGHTNLAGGGGITYMVKMINNVSTYAAAQAAQTVYFKDLHMRDVQIGVPGGTSVTQGGGIGGVCLVANVNGRLGATEADCDKNVAGVIKPGMVYETYENATNTVIDQVHLTDVHQWSGQTPVNPSSPGNPFQLGGEALVKYARITNCSARNTGDIGFEVDNGIDVVLDGCTVHNSDGNSFLFLPFTGSVGTETAHIRVLNCSAIWDKYDDDGSLITGWSPGNGFRVNTRFGVMGRGQFTFENCDVRMESGWNTSYQHWYFGPTAQVNVINCRSVMRGAPTGGSYTFCHMDVWNTGCEMTLNIDNFQAVTTCPIDTVTLTNQWLRVSEAANLHLNVRGFSGYSNGAQTGGGGRKYIGIDLNQASTSKRQESFTTADQLSTVCKFESGTSNNYTGLSAGAYTATANLTTEERAIYVAQVSDTNSINLIARPQDGSAYTKFTTGSSVTLYKAGAFGKRQASDTYLEAYAYDDGAASYLCLDKVIAGVRTTLVTGTPTGYNNGASLATATISTTSAYTTNKGITLDTRLTTATDHYPVITVIGNTVYAEHWTSAEPPVSTATHPSVAGDAYFTVTLAGTDIALFGTGSMGEFGFTQVPITNTAKISKVTHRRLGVLNGQIADWDIQHLGTPAFQSTGLVAAPPYDGRWRINGSLFLKNMNFQQLGPAGLTITDLSITDGSSGKDVQRKIITKDCTFYNAVADVSATFVSGTALQNIYGSQANLVIAGGTVTKVELSKDGSTFRDTGVTAGSVRVPANWWVKLTHSGAPTAFWMKED